MADVHTALAEPPPFELHRHEPKQTCPVGYGIRPVLHDVYVDTAIRATLATRTIAGILDTTLIEHALPSD